MNDIEKVLRIKSLCEKMEFNKAIKEAKIYIKEGVNLPFLYHGTAIAYIATEQFNQAVSILKEAETKFPDYYEFYELFGEAYSGLEDHDNAIRYYELAMEKANKSDKEYLSDLITKIAESKFIKGEEKNANNLWERALDIYPDNTFAKETAGFYNQTTVDTAGIKSTIDIFKEFSNQKEAEYLKNRKIEKFSSGDEMNKVQSKIEEAFRSEVIPNLEIIKELKGDSRTEWFKRIEIDYLNEVTEIISESQLSLDKELNERFSFLPENGIRIAYMARPALKIAGMSEEKLISFVLGKTRPNKKDIKLLKWAYEIGKKILDLNNYDVNMEAFEKDFLDIVRERLNKESAILCLYQIIDVNLHSK